MMSFEFLIHKTWHLRASCISASRSRVESIDPVLVRYCLCILKMKLSLLWGVKGMKPNDIS